MANAGAGPLKWMIRTWTPGDLNARYNFVLISYSNLTH